MAAYDSAYLLKLFDRKAGRPVADAITDAAKYERLSESQNRLIAEIAGVAPDVLYPKVAYGSIPTLTSADGQVFTFGTDTNGYPIFPMGHGGIFASLADIPNRPWVEGVDFVNEGTQIRIPNNGSYSGTLYWYGIANPADISASSEPSIFPAPARELIVIDAVRQYATEFTRHLDLAAAMTAEWNVAWPKWCLAWKTQFASGGALVLSRSAGNGGGGGSSGGGTTVIISDNSGYWNAEYFG